MAILNFFVKAILAAVLCLKCAAKSDQNLILILIDGFANYYLNQTGITLNGFNQLAENGVQAEYLKPDFPTLSLPNYYTIVTGLHVESHGMTGNYIFDRRSNLTFSMGLGSNDYIPLWWNKTTPIWITAESQGVGTGAYWWIGCQVKFPQGKMNDCHPYIGAVKTQEMSSKFDRILKNFRTKQAQFEMLYFETVDHYAHIFGPESEPANTAVYQIDTYLQLLQLKIDQANMWSNTNVIVVSDHGQVRFNILDRGRIVILDKCISDWSAIQLTVDRGPFQQVFVSQESRTNEVYRNLTMCLPNEIKVYKREDIPERWHYRNGPFLPEIILVPDMGYAVFTRKVGKQFPAGVLPTLGVHGYDNKYSEMNAIFFARGSCFKRNFRNRWMNGVDVYQIMTTILDIHGHANNGTWNSVESMLTEECLDTNRVKLKSDKLKAWLRYRSLWNNVKTE